MTTTGSGFSPLWTRPVRRRNGRCMASWRLRNLFHLVIEKPKARGGSGWGIGRSSDKRSRRWYPMVLRQRHRRSSGNSRLAKPRRRERRSRLPYFFDAPPERQDNAGVRGALVPVASESLESKRHACSYRGNNTTGDALLPDFYRRTGSTVFSGTGRVQEPSRRIGQHSENR